MNYSNNSFGKFFIIFAFLLLLNACSHVDVQPLPTITSQQLTQLLAPNENTILGNPNGDITLVEFFDYQCPYCRKMLPTILQLPKTDPNLRIVLKEYLLFGPTSELATRAALAAQKQGKYLAMHNALMTAMPPLDNDKIMALAKSLNLDTTQLTKDMVSSEINQAINANTQLADALNLTAAPVFIILKTNQSDQSKSIMFIGEASLDQFTKLIAQVRNK